MPSNAKVISPGDWEIWPTPLRFSLPPGEPCGAYIALSRPAVACYHERMTRTKTKPRNRGEAAPYTPPQIVPGFEIHARIHDLDWQPASGGCVFAEVHSHQAGEVYLEAGPTADGKFYATALGFLGTAFWEHRPFDTLEGAQLQAVAWWMHVTRHERNTARRNFKNKEKQPQTA